MDLRALPRSGQFPIAVDVAVPVEPTAKAGGSVRLDEMRKVGFVEPRRQRPVDPRIAKKPLAVFDEQRGSRIGKPAAKQGSHRQGHIALEFLFRDARSLKILPVEIRDAAVAQRTERQAASAEGRWYAQARNSVKNIRTE